MPEPSWDAPQIDSTLPESATRSGERSRATERFRAARDALLATRDDYESAVQHFVWPEFDEFNYALDWFDVLATDSETADRRALWLVEEDGSERRLTYAELRAASNRAANWFRSIGIGRGSRVLMVLGNQVEMWVGMLGLMKLGAIIMPTTTLADAVELRQRITAGRVDAVIARAEDERHYGELDDLTESLIMLRVGTAGLGSRQDAWHDFSDETLADQDEEFTADGPTRASDTLFLYSTSGTTARAKLVEHTHVSYTVGHLSTMYWIGLQPGDVHLNISSPGWGKHAWSNFFAPFHAAATVFLFNYERFDAERLMDEMDRASITSFCAPPTVWRMLIQSRLSRLPHPPQSVVGAGEPLNPEVIAQVQDAWGVTIRDGYGQTETTLQIGNFPGQNVKAGSMGKPAPGYRISLRDEDGNEVSDANLAGEICIDLDHRPLGLTPGYENAPDLTDAAMRDGWYHTGDVAWRDEDGFIFYEGRTDDVFKASDYRIWPFELESVLLEHEWVREAAVIPSPDPVRLAVPKAYVILVADVAPDDATATVLFDHARDRLSPYKRIRRLTFTDALPQTISGKIRRVELRRREQQAYEDGAQPSDEFRN